MVNWLKYLSCLIVGHNISKKQKTSGGYYTGIRKKIFYECSKCEKILDSCDSKPIGDNKKRKKKRLEEKYGF